MTISTGKTSYESTFTQTQEFVISKAKLGGQICPKNDKNADMYVYVCIVDEYIHLIDIHCLKINEP